MAVAVKAYAGRRPFIFLSYSHKDTEIAYPLIDELQKRGFNVWFDEGIHSGVQWKRTITEHINSCSLMIFLVTQNSLDSAECEKEIYFATEKGKRFINVVMGSPQLPDWFIFDFKRYQYVDQANFPSNKAMLDKLEEDLIFNGLNPEVQKPEIHEARPITSAKAPWVCKSCGSNNSGDDDVCEVCGSSDRYVAPKETPAPSPRETTSSVDPSSLRKKYTASSGSTSTSTSRSSRSTSRTRSSSSSLSGPHVYSSITSGGKPVSTTATTIASSTEYVSLTPQKTAVVDGITVGEGSICPTGFLGYTETLPTSLHVRSGNEIYFGNYPQKKVTDTKILAGLNSGLIPLNPDQRIGAGKIYTPKIWTPFEYYIKSKRKDFMFFTDKIYNGKKYRGVFFTEPRQTAEKAGDPCQMYQEMRGYRCNVIHWFEYSPIKWRIIQKSGSASYLLCDLILDSQKFSFRNGVATVDYSKSDIRFWLNDHFFRTAFTPEERNYIVLSTVDNSSDSTTHPRNPNAGANTMDRVFLPSLQELTTIIKDGKERIRVPSDYAACQGTFICNFDKTAMGNGWWWTRSPTSTTTQYVHYITYKGELSNYYPQHTHFGIVPAIKVLLPY